MKLAAKNITKYLNSLKIFKGVGWQKVEVAEVIEHTNVNFVFFADLNSSGFKRVYLKQAFGFVKIKPDFPAPIERQKLEKLSIDFLQSFWRGRIPEVIYYDKKNNVLILTDVGEKAELLANEIKKGRLHFEIGSNLGLMMAQLHVPTFDQDDFPVRGAKANQEHVDFILGFRLGGAKEILPQETEKIFQESLRVKSSMIYGDWASKNVFVAGNKVRLVDFENLVRFDPAFDIGYALAHWVLDISKENKDQMAQFFKDFEDSYQKNWPETKKKEVLGIFERASRYTGAMMLHRLAGVKNTNRMEEYLAKEVPLIEIAKKLMQGNFASSSAAIRETSL